jgi:hypothetical protein
MDGMNKSDWLIAAQATADDISKLLLKLDRSEHVACKGCGTRRARNWNEERAARELEGAITRIRKAVEFVDGAPRDDREG